LLIVIILTIFLVGVTSSMLIIRDNNMTDVDIVALNDTVKTVETHWGQISKETFTSSDIQQPFSIIDDIGNVIYETTGNHYSNINDAIKNRATIIDVKRNHEIVGKIIVHNNEQAIIQHIKGRLMLSISLILALVMIVSLIYLLFIYRTI